MPRNKEATYRVGKIEPMVQPQDGYETDAEVEAANKNRRVDYLNRLAHRKDQAARDTKDEASKADHYASKAAYKAHADVLYRLMIHRENGFHTPEHLCNEDYLKNLEKYRESRYNLKLYGRWEQTFKK